MIDIQVLLAPQRLRRAINAPWRGEPEHKVTAGRGKIAAAYKAADELCDIIGVPRAPVVTEFCRVS